LGGFRADGPGVCVLFFLLEVALDMVLRALARIAVQFIFWLIASTIRKCMGYESQGFEIDWDDLRYGEDDYFDVDYFVPLW
jgi:hypothetical protein